LTLAALAAASFPLNVFAGTTGGIVGRVADSVSQAPIAGAVVTATSPTQTATTTTDADGSYRFLTLVPDTYTLQFSAAGYDQISQPGITVLADQRQSLNVSLVKTLKTIAKVTSRAAGNLVKAGTGSDVYSVNATQASAATGLAGAGTLSNAYGAIASVPGVSLSGGESGWFQEVHIRGGDIDQVGYELDGIPVNRVYDNAPQTMLSSLGQQELQVYTGGTPASADAQGISGYINQVVKTGTYPGYGDGALSVGFPAFFHGASIEAGGSNPDRTFSYYVGLGGTNQSYRYIDNSNGASDLSSFFYPVNLVDPSSFLPGSCMSPQSDPVKFDCGNVIPGSSVQTTVYTGGNGTNPQTLFANGNAFGNAFTEQRDSLVNFHFAIPHKNSGLRDDVQALWMTSEVFLNYYSSQSDLGAVTNQPYYGSYTWDNSSTYNGPLMQPANAASVQPYLFPSSGQQNAGALLPQNLRDANDNGVSVSKLQYQHPFSSRSYLRLYGYLMYSNWFINGPNTAAQPDYGAELADYEIPDHTFGGNISYTNQLSDKNLLTVSYGYTGSNLQRYYVGYIHPNYNVANFVGSNGECYDPGTGAQVGCYAQNTPTEPYLSYGVGNIGAVASGTLPAVTMPAGSPGAVENAQWLITNNNFNAALNQVHTRFSGLSIGDEWRPNDPWDVNIGLRIENFRYIYGDTGANDPARQFWFTHYNAEYCQIPGQAPFYNGVDGTPCPMVTFNGQSIQSASPNLQNPTDPPDYVVARFEPRLSFTYSLNQNNVLRGSAGVYARPPNSSWVEYNVMQQDLPTYLGSHFAAFGFNTPEHNIRPDTSYNYDFSWESHLKGTDFSFKLTPFYRATRDQLQNFFIDPQGGLESGLNVGNQVSSGVEFALTYGDFNRDGWSGQLSYTYTHSAIKYQNFSGQNVNVIDQLNGYISAYNAFTQKGGGSPCYLYESGGTAGGGVSCATPGSVANPYYNSNPQSLLDRNAWYPTYDVIPGPLAGSNGYAVPDVVALLVNYKHARWTVTPTLSFSTGAEYGSPTVWPGYNPQSCYQPPLGWATAHGNAADPANCDDFGGLPLFIPDPYTGQYDNLGAFKEPWRLTVGIGFTYDVSPRIKARLNVVNLADVCGQRGYAWDNNNVCVYGSLPSGILAPEGNFYPNSQAATAPPQLQFPYSFLLNNNNTGFVGVRQPIQLTGVLDIKL
jgi:hypothetical protein